MYVVSAGGRIARWSLLESKRASALYAEVISYTICGDLPTSIAKGLLYLFRKMTPHTLTHSLKNLGNPPWYTEESNNLWLRFR